MKKLLLIPICFLSITISAFGSTQEDQCKAYIDINNSKVILTNNTKGDGIIYNMDCLELAKVLKIDRPTVGGVPVDSIQIDYMFKKNKPEPVVITYNNTVKNLIDNRCNTCHMPHAGWNTYIQAKENLNLLKQGFTDHQKLLDDDWASDLPNEDIGVTLKEREIIQAWISNSAPE